MTRILGESAAEQREHDAHRDECRGNDDDHLGHGAEPGSTQAVHGEIVLAAPAASPAHKSRLLRTRSSDR